MTSRVITIDDLNTAQFPVAADTWARSRGILGATQISMKASEALVAGDFINIFENNSTPSLRKANASDPQRFANGFILVDAAINTNVVAFLMGMNTAVVVPNTLGEVYLSDSTAGKAMTTAPTTSGHIKQSLGVAIGGVGIFFVPKVWTLL